MKRFLLVAMILVSAASVYAADLKITGDAEVRGVMYNAEYDGDVYAKDMIFDADFNFNAALVLTENTTIFTKLTFDAETYEGTATVPDSTATDAVAMLGVERAYISTKFLPVLTVDAGLMGGGMWGTDFGNTETNVTRIKGTYAVSDDIKVMAIYEKGYESNADTIYAAVYAAAIAGGASDTDAAAAAAAAAGDISETSDFGDTTSYYLAASIKAGAFTIMPLFKYQINETNTWVAETTSGADLDYAPYGWTIDIAATGDMGMVGFEAEVVYQAVNWDGFPGKEDESKYGIYANVFAKLEMAKAGVALFYESADEKDGQFAAGYDFDFTIITEDISFTNTMAAKLYASDIKIVDKITANAAFAYGMQVNDDAALGGEYSFWEVDAGVSYAIDAATSYTIEGGYFAGDDTVATDSMYMVRQVIAVKF